MRKLGGNSPRCFRPKSPVSVSEREQVWRGGCWGPFSACWIVSKVQCGGIPSAAKCLVLALRDLDLKVIFTRSWSDELCKRMRLSRASMLMERECESRTEPWRREVTESGSWLGSNFTLFYSIYLLHLVSLFQFIFITSSRLINIWAPRQKRAAYLGGNSSGLVIWDWNPEVRSEWTGGSGPLLWAWMSPSFMRSGMNWGSWHFSFPAWKCLRQWGAKDVEWEWWVCAELRKKTAPSNLPSNSWFVSLWSDILKLCYVVKCSVDFISFLK